MNRLNQYRVLVYLCYDEWIDASNGIVEKIETVETESFGTECNEARGKSPRLRRVAVFLGVDDGGDDALCDDG